MSSVKLDDIPDDLDAQLPSSELATLHNILNVKEDNPSMYEDIKPVLYATTVFALMSLPFIDRVIELCLPLANSWLILLGVKTILFFIVFYIVNYINN